MKKEETLIAASGDKKLLRAEILALRDAMDAAVRATADARIRENLKALSVFETAQTVFCYVSVKSEVDTRVLIEEMLASGKTVCVPRCGSDGIMQAHSITGLDELEEGTMGIPAASADAPKIAPEALDLVIVPCLACDRNCNRLGYGGGYYDRYLLRATKAASAMLCRDTFLIEQLPSEPHDVKPALIVTDKEVLSL